MYHGTKLLKITQTKNAETNADKKLLKLTQTKIAEHNTDRPEKQHNGSSARLGVRERVEHPVGVR